MTESRPRGRLACCAVLALLLVASPRSARSVDGFLSIVEDLPLMAGLTEDKTSSLAFDTADGRIVDAYAHGTVSERQVVDFYGETLPQLGWKAEGKTQYARNGERLRLDFAQGAGGLTVHYALSPH
jgi:hypothetical protein